MQSRQVEKVQSTGQAQEMRIVQVLQEPSTPPVQVRSIGQELEHRIGRVQELRLIRIGHQRGRHIGLEQVQQEICTGLEQELQEIRTGLEQVLVGIHIHLALGLQEIRIGLLQVLLETHIDLVRVPQEIHTDLQQVRQGTHIGRVDLAWP